MKTCNRCKSSKPITEFIIDKSNIDQLSKRCISCINYQNNYNKKYYQQNKDIALQYRKKYYQNNKDKILIAVNKYYILNKEHIYQIKKIYKKNNRKNINRKQRQKRKENISIRLRHNISSEITRTMKINKIIKNNSIWNKLLYTPQELKSHLESLWEPWMSWDNYGAANTKKRTWQIDHIIPQSKLSFESLDHPNFLKCWSLENLRPLDSIENIKKSNKFKILF